MTNCLGILKRNLDYWRHEISVSFMKRGSVIVVEPKDEADAISLYNELLGKTISKPAN